MLRFKINEAGPHNGSSIMFRQFPELSLSGPPRYHWVEIAGVGHLLIEIILMLDLSIYFPISFQVLALKNCELILFIFIVIIEFSSLLKELLTYSCHSPSPDT